MSARLDFVFIGLAITSSWGNGHATTYRSLIKGLQLRGHRALFLERDQPWYAHNRDASGFSHCDTQLYADVTDLRERFAERIATADTVVVGSYVKDGREVCDWVLDRARGVSAFYDIDTPVTLSHLRSDTCEYLRADQVPEFDLILSFTGGPILQRLESVFGAQRARALYCSVDVDGHQPQDLAPDLDLGYMGTYSADRQGSIESLLNEPARCLPECRFAVVGAQYPDELQWPANVRRVDHLAPAEHARFFSRQRFTLNVTRQDMRRAGHSPSVRLFEAAACGAPIISDAWPGIDELLLPGEEILIANRASDVIGYLQNVSEPERKRIALRARERVLAAHSSLHRATELEQYVLEAQQGAALGSRREAGAESRRIAS